MLTKSSFSLALLVSLLATSPSARADVGDNAVGMNAHIPATSVVDLVDDLGDIWMRVDNNWFQQTDPCGSIGFIAPLDTAVSDAIGKGLKVYMTLAYTPACASTANDDGLSNLNDVPVAAEYGDYVHASVAYYRAMGVTHFGIWNEANLAGFFEGTPAEYVTNVVTPGIAAIASGCAAAAGGPFSDCLALGPDLAHVGDYDVYLDQTLTLMNDASLEFDILAHHIYQKFWTQIWDGDSFINALHTRRFSFTRRSLVDVLEENGFAPGHVPNIEVWITETGYKNGPPMDSGEMDLQASHYMDVISEQLARPWYTNTFFYEILDSGDELDGYGCTRNDGSGGYLLKTAYLALQQRIIDEPELSGGGGSTECSDGIDNDGDTLADMADPGCSDPTDDDESDDPPPPLPEELVALPDDDITIDGDFSDWSDEEWIEITSPDDYISVDTPPGDAADLSARLAARWDASAVYFAFEVTDQTHDNSNAADLLWLGDSVQVAFDVARNGGTEYDDSDDFEYGWADDGTALTYRWHAPTGAAAATNSFAIVRSASTTRYEIKMPASDFGLSSLAESMKIGCSLLINDDDGSGRRGYIQWTSGIGQFKHPDDFGVLGLYTEPPPPPDAGLDDDAGVDPDGSVVSPDGGTGGDGGTGDDDGGGGCCQTSSNELPRPATLLLALGLFLALRQRS